MRKAVGDVLLGAIVLSIPALIVVGAVFFIFSGKKGRFEID
jgi:hypothetical protein